MGTALANDSGTVVGTEGFYVDVTEAVIRQLQAGVTAAVAIVGQIAAKLADR